MHNWLCLYTRNNQPKIDIKDNLNYNHIKNWKYLGINKYDKRCTIPIYTETKTKKKKLLKKLKKTERNG